MTHELTLLPESPVAESPAAERLRTAGALRHAPIALLLGLQGSLAPEWTFLLTTMLLGARFALRGFRLPIVPTLFWMPFLVALAAGSLSALAWEARDVVRDLWLIGAPAVLFVLGWDLARAEEDFRALARAVVVGALVAALLHLARAVEHAELLAIGRDLFRQSAGGGSVLPTFALFLLFAHKGLDAEPLFRRRSFVALVAGTCLAAQFVSFSRTWWLAMATFVALYSAMRWGALATGFVLAGGATLALSLDAVTLQGRLADRVGAFGAEALTESLAPRNFTSQRDLNAYWRSYESYRALESVERSGPLALLIGQGLGTRLDLGMYQLLDGEYRRLVPVLHNGFLYLALKSGLLGLAAHAAWLTGLAFAAWTAARRRAGEARVAALLALGAVLVLIESTVFVGGAFNFRPAYPTLLVLGMSLRQARREEGTSG